MERDGPPLVMAEIGVNHDGDVGVARQLIAAIGSEVERLRVITEGYLDRARPAPAQRADLDLAELVQSLHEFVRSDLERRGVRSKVAARPGVKVDGDPGQLRQALWNLVRNAWEAMPNGGPLWLEVLERRDDDGLWAVLAVEDGGPGVADTQREAIFQPFTTTKDRGTGIGLALVREVALAHRGRIELVRGQHGGGARFELVLPAS